MKKGIFIGLSAILATFVASCDTECETVTTRNITILVDATDSLLVDKAQQELRKDNFEQLVNKKLGLTETPTCFTVNYDFGYISTHSYYNPTSTQLSQTKWGQAKNKLVLGWRSFYDAHEKNLQSLDSLGNMENTSLFPTLMKAIRKTDGILIVVSDLIENNPAVNFYKNPPTTPEQMEKAYQKMAAYYLPDTIGSTDEREVLFIVLSEPKNSAVVHKARAFWKYALEEQMGLQVSFADGISTL
ncbi:hypothetical protein FK220_006455 [Flavobacteriaceae bacterium TP-CH-4]|uniref:Uncharacterized protein n=1 Tax=Pelagihabitans pacificus TaxID=2696054 RepID=A0A967AS40_9FLAO|nr:hypothetical protein [Pelagihabitans pacificus]NHF58972.1 hypothetical protein [Pelagihabitans pacificus]